MLTSVKNATKQYINQVSRIYIDGENWNVLIFKIGSPGLASYTQASLFWNNLKMFKQKHVFWVQSCRNFNYLLTIRNKDVPFLTTKYDFPNSKSRKAIKSLNRKKLKNLKHLFFIRLFLLRPQKLKLVFNLIENIMFFYIFSNLKQIDSLYLQNFYYIHLIKNLYDRITYKMEKLI